MKKLIGLSIASVVAGCASVGEMPMMPDNFTSRIGAYDKPYVDKARFEFAAPDVPSFTERVARCGVTNLSAEAFVAKSTSTWVGPATGTVYKTGAAREVAGTEVVKHVGESENIVVLTGRETYGDATGLQAALVGVDAFRQELEYDIEAKLEGDRYSLTFMDIRRAWHDSSMPTNQGLQPVGIWNGSKADEIVPLIEATATRLNDCIKS